MENTQFSKMHAFILFWLGVLTGAVIVGLLFAYNLQLAQLQTSTINTRLTPTTQEKLAPTQIKKTTAPQTTTTTSTTAAPIPNPYAPIPNPY